MDVVNDARRKSLITRRGAVGFPAYIPVTTFGQKYPLDDLVRPYLPRLASAVMVSYHYAKQQNTALRLPMFVDSGGFASLFEHATVVEEAGLGTIELNTNNGVEKIRASEVLEFQEQVADAAFTLDFPIPPSMDARESSLRQRLTIANADWALRNRRRRDLPLYACVQGWNLESYCKCAEAYADKSFEGIAIGGLVPRIRDRPLVSEVVKSVRRIHPETPLHVFGLGHPELVKDIFAAGADSVDSSAYVKLAAEGKYWGAPQRRNPLASPFDRLRLALANLAYATNSSVPFGLPGLLTGAPTSPTTAR